MDVEKLLGTWFKGRFQMYQWECECYEDLSWREACVSSDGQPSIRYVVKLSAYHDYHNMSGNEYNIYAQEEFWDYQLDMMDYLDHREFIRTSFMRLFNSFVKEYTKLIPEYKVAEHLMRAFGEG